MDINFKTLVWNSQNVDRETGAKAAGICPCLTPNMVPYVTNRGGPLVGHEVLSLQGIPVDDLLLTRESTDQMADLAGNAMTSTIVGTCILAALLLGRDHLMAYEGTPKAAAIGAEGAGSSSAAPKSPAKKGKKPADGAVSSPGGAGLFSANVASPSAIAKEDSLKVTKLELNAIGAQVAYIQAARAGVPPPVCASEAAPAWRRTSSSA